MPAYGCGRARTTLNNNSPSPSEKFLAKAKPGGQKEKGVWGKESVFAIPALAGRQNRKIFVPLIEKRFARGRLKNV